MNLNDTLTRNITQWIFEAIIFNECIGLMHSSLTCLCALPLNVCFRGKSVWGWHSLSGCKHSGHPAHHLPGGKRAVTVSHLQRAPPSQHHQSDAGLSAWYEWIGNMTNKHRAGSFCKWRLSAHRCFFRNQNPSGQRTWKSSLKHCYRWPRPSLRLRWAAWAWTSDPSNSGEADLLNIPESKRKQNKD